MEILKEMQVISALKVMATKCVGKKKDLAISSLLLHNSHR
jgi:hypothetical protein